MAIYFLDEQKTKKFQVKPKAFWRNTQVIYNDSVIDTIVTSDELRSGKSYDVEPGMNVHVQLVKNGFGEPEMLALLLNGKPMKGSAADPMTGINAAFGIMIFIGALNIIVGLIGMFQDENGMLAQMGVGSISCLMGLVFLGLAFIFRSTKTMWPVIVGIALVILDMVLTMMASAGEEGGRFPTGVGLKVLLIIWLLRGIRGVKAYQQQKDQAA